ncbi:MAG: helix-turn-helix domain-containing protein, partial [Fidelibacterota bacterium]
KGSFREDLFFRLSVVPIELPPLRERKEDIPFLADHFLKIYREKNQRLIKGFDPQTIDLVMKYHWPGNIRELENTVERAVILSREEYITPQILPSAIKALLYKGEIEKPLALSGNSLRDMEIILIRETLKSTNGNKSKAAEVLGITRQTLANKIRQYEIE